MKVSVTFHNGTESWRGGVEKGFISQSKKKVVSKKEQLIAF